MVPTKIQISLLTWVQLILTCREQSVNKYKVYKYKNNMLSCYPTCYLDFIIIFYNPASSMLV